MTYLKNLFLNFLIVFFANYLLPGMEIVNPSKLPRIGGDIIFPVVLGFLISMIYPFLKIVDSRVNIGRIVVISGVVSFVAYAIAKFAPPIGIEVKTVEGYLFASIAVSLGGILTNYLEMKKSSPSEMPKL